MRSSTWLLPPAVLSLFAACGGPGGAHPVKAPTTGEAFGGSRCSAVRPQSEPDLMGWDPASRAHLAELSRQGVVAVRYEAHGCDVRLEILSDCIGRGTYSYAAYPEQQTKTAKTAGELFASLPLGAAHLVGKLRGERMLRTDYVLVGVASLTAGSMFDAGRLSGPDCARATHVVSRIYVGGFAMVAGASRLLTGAASFFTASAGGQSENSIENVARGGDAEACKKAFSDGKPTPLCNVPLRIGLTPINRRANGTCPDVAGGPSSKHQFDDCLQACNDGVSAACRQVGIAHKQGNVATADVGQARTFWRKGCDGGDGGSCLLLANEGDAVVEPSTTEGAKTLVARRDLVGRGCELGSHKACSEFRVIKERLERNREQLEAGCRVRAPGKADPTDASKDCLYLGMMKEYGLGGPEKHAEAARALSRACSLARYTSAEDHICRLACDESKAHASDHTATTTLPSSCQPLERNPLVQLTPCVLETASSVRFQGRTATIDKQSEKILDAVVAVMKANPGLAIEVQSYWDGTRGSSDQARDLTLRQATAVMNQLVKRGIQRERLHAAGFGWDRPLVPTTDAEHLAKNRRVSFVRVPGGKKCPGFRYTWRP